MCFVFIEEPSHRDNSFEYPQHMFWLRNKKNNFQLHTLIWGSDHGSSQLFFLFEPESMSIQLIKIKIVSTYHSYRSFHITRFPFSKT